ncbi:MAG TPA: 50S ribosomal protein L25 [Candidatus Paceibacterota bacterium]|nr:50S ribosomal protein L25 [Candidatus Paceibacterota bacterium]
MITLPVEKRADGGPKAAAVRRAGSIPAVVYGGKRSATSITVNERVFEKVLKEAGESTIVSLTGLGEEVPTLIHDVDLDPVTHTPRHVDFYAITKGEKVEIALPLDFVGESPAVAEGANLVKVMHELEVEADPMKLPHDIKVDLSKLAAIGDQIHAKDLALPDGVTLNVDGDEVVALVQEVVEEKEEVAPADLSSIEVEGEKKEGEAAAEGEAAGEAKVAE